MTLAITGCQSPWYFASLHALSRAHPRYLDRPDGQGKQQVTP